MPYVGAFLNLIYPHLSLETKRDGRKKRPQWRVRLQTLQTMNLATDFGLSPGLACSLGLLFFSLSLPTQAWPLSLLFSTRRIHIYPNYICENKLAHVCILVSHWIFLIWKKNPKKSVIASPAVPAFAVSEQNIFIASWEAVALAWSLARVENPGVPPSLLNTFTIHEGWDTVIMIDVNIP